LLADGVFDWPKMPDAALQIDTSIHAPRKAAELIADELLLRG